MRADIETELKQANAHKALAYIEQLEALLASYDKVRIALQASQPQEHKHYFICGEAGKKDAHNLPQHIDICPEYGSTIWVRYTKTNLQGDLEW